MNHQQQLRRLSQVLGRQADNDDSVSVAEAIQAMLREQRQPIADKRLKVELEIEDSLHESHSRLPNATIERILDHAIDRCPSDGDLLITALETQQGIEIEIADSGTDVVESSRLTAFRPAAVDEATLDILPAATGTDVESDYKVLCVRCPQGGLAWTIVRRRLNAALKAA